MRTTIFLTDPSGNRLFDATISKDFAEQAEALGIDEHLFDPDKAGMETAADLVEPLQNAVESAEDGPLKNWLAKYLAVCQNCVDNDIDAKLVVTRIPEPGDEAAD